MWALHHCQKLSMRLGGHVANYKYYLDGKGYYVTSFKILENHDYDIVLIESFPCENKDELHRKESLPGQTRKEYYSKNAQKILDQQKQYWSNNKQKIIERHKKYYLLNKDRIALRNKRYTLLKRIQCQYKLSLTLFRRAHDLIQTHF